MHDREEQSYAKGMTHALISPKHAASMVKIAAAKPSSAAARAASLVARTFSQAGCATAAR